MPAKALMIQGTASHVGKSAVAAAFCRILTRRGYRVVPFKAQNMSNNSCVAKEGGEIGRAQAVQAEACGLEPSILMNPVLLKPESDSKAQVVLMGKPVARLTSIADPLYQKRCVPRVREALKTLMGQYDYVVIEGAGSPAEVNLKRHDFVNMRTAKLAKAHVILVGDIDWGGIFAQLVGTYELLAGSEKKRVQAFLINKFRGNPKILKPGLDWITRRTGKKVLGVLPFVSDFDLDEEDSISQKGGRTDLNGLRANTYLDALSGNGRDHRSVHVTTQQLLIDVIWLPHVSNFTDFHALEREKNVVLRYLDKPDRHRLPDLVILPGTKSTLKDLEHVRKSGLADYITRCARAGVPVLGICGGYQMLGRSLSDPMGVESDGDSRPGLGLLPVRTVYHREKKTTRVRAVHLESRSEVSGYEIHIGQTKALNGAAPFLKILERDGQQVKSCYDGVFIKKDATYVMGTYVHGLFDHPGFRRHFLNQMRFKAGLASEGTHHEGQTLNPFDRWADIVEENIDRKFFERMMDLR